MTALLLLSLAGCPVSLLSRQSAALLLLFTQTPNRSMVKRPIVKVPEIAELLPLFTWAIRIARRFFLGSPRVLGELINSLSTNFVEYASVDVPTGSLDQRVKAVKLEVKQRETKQRRVVMKADVEKKINARTAAAFEDMVSGMSSKAKNGILTATAQLVKTVWLAKIYAAMPADKTTVDEYFLDQELEQFLNEAVEECHKRVETIAENVKREF
ncbi:MAG TPA: hypothetical protein VFU31_20810 [Candidatus Binatia bacterium]|nr:hypothetical protein [Candidatus Binatia bacterium]